MLRSASADRGSQQLADLRDQATIEQRERCGIDRGAGGAERHELQPAPATPPPRRAWRRRRRTRARCSPPPAARRAETAAGRRSTRRRRIARSKRRRTRRVAINTTTIATKPRPRRTHDRKPGNRDHRGARLHPRMIRALAQRLVDLAEVLRGRGDRRPGAHPGQDRRGVAPLPDRTRPRPTAPRPDR